MIEYRLKRSQRKTVAIHITQAAEVEVRAPLKLPKATIDGFVAQKENWIRQKLALMQDRAQQRQGFSIGHGDTLLLMGKAYRVQESSDNRVRFDGESFHVPPVDFTTVKPALIKLYKRIAEGIIKERVAHFAGSMGVVPVSVSINAAQKRWGSCSGQNRLNFSFLLCMADAAAIDYVVVHELAHIREHNHSPRFWAIVQAVCPDYKQRQQTLKTLQQKLAAQDWG